MSESEQPLRRATQSCSESCLISGINHFMQILPAYPLRDPLLLGVLNTMKRPFLGNLSESIPMLKDMEG